MKKLLLVCLLLVSTHALAELRKWVDAEGKVQYSDQLPPPNVKAKILHIPASAAAPGVVAGSSPVQAKTIAEREAELKKAQLDKKQAADKVALEQARIAAEKENCSAAQLNLRTLQDGTRMLVVDAKGQRSYLDDEQRRQRIEKGQENVKTFCK